MITLNWIGGEHSFALRIGELRALQERCEAGPLEVMHRIMDGRWRVDDLVEPLRLGLIGAGSCGEAAARNMVSGLVEQHPMIRFAAPAQAVLIDALVGPATDDDREDSPEGKTDGVKPDAGISVASTGTAP